MQRSSIKSTPVVNKTLEYSIEKLFILNRALGKVKFKIQINENKKNEFQFMNQVEIKEIKRAKNKIKNNKIKKEERIHNWVIYNNYH